eukprot:6780998-Prymnesium_polylepis.1
MCIRDRRRARRACVRTTRRGARAHRGVRMLAGTWRARGRQIARLNEASARLRRAHVVQQRHGEGGTTAAA